VGTYSVEIFYGGLWETFDITVDPPPFTEFQTISIGLPNGAGFDVDVFKVVRRHSKTEFFIFVYHEMIFLSCS
jgi:hypothetical protein